ncbi:acyltransferase [Polaribacter atrinae]|uniref:acyltransferase n=1 Tax=Polaribacter atrinae TaxID=1333662 RepID=UPI001E34718E|nr:acyltransferase [Polaribacter atrinae]
MLHPVDYARTLGVKIGKDCSIAINYFGSEPYLIEIGNHVQITADVRFFNHGGSWMFREVNPEFDYFGKIKVGNNVYIGNCALIMPGVTIGNNVIIGAGTVVTKSVQNDCILAGNPGKVVGNVNELYSRVEKYNLNIKSMSNLEKQKYLLKLTDEKFITK